MSRQQVTGRWNTLFLLFCVSLLVAKSYAWDPYGGIHEGGGTSGWGGPWNNYNGNGGGRPTPTSVNDNGNNVATVAVTTTAATAAYDGGGHGPNYGSGSGIGGNSGNGNGNGNGNGFGGSSSSSSFGPGFDVESATHLRTIHGILAAVAFVGLFPVGAVLVRVVPGRFTWIIHALTQALAYVMFVGAAVLGLYLVSMVKIPPNGASLLEQASTNAHPIIGLIVLGVLTLQPALGLVHHLRYKRTGGRTWWSHAHIWAGRVAVTLGIVNGGIGLGLARASRGAIATYAVVAVIVWLLWMVVAAWGEVRIRRRGEVGGETGRLRGGEEPKDGPDTEGAATGPSSVRSDIPRGGDIDGTAATGGGGHGGSTTTAARSSGVSAMSSSRASNTTAEAEAAAAAIAASFLQQARPYTPSPPYTPGPAASTEWTIYGGPGLNNTPRGNHTAIPTQEPPKSG